MANSSDNSKSKLRYDWLNALKKEDLKILCQNRQIDTDNSSREAMTTSLLKSAPFTEYNRLKKAQLSAELKAKGIAHKANKKSELIELLNKTKNKRMKCTNNKLQKCTVSELQMLCESRGIDTKSINAKKKLIQLLESTNAPDPEYTESMISKQLMAEMRGRGLSVSKMDKEKMLHILQSGLTFRESQLRSHTNGEQINNIITDTDYALTDFMKYIKENIENITKLTKQKCIGNSNHKFGTKKRDFLSQSEWLKLEECLRTARNEIIELRTMMEIYGDTDFGKEEKMAKYKHFENVISDSEDSKEKEREEIVYIVYDDSDELIMAQNSKDAILGMFANESEAEQYKNQLLKDGTTIAIQEIVVNHYNGADP